MLPGSRLLLPAAAVFLSEARRPGDARRLHFHPGCLLRGRLVRLGARKGRGQRCWLQSGPLDKVPSFLRPGPSHPPLHDPRGPFTCPRAPGCGYPSSPPCEQCSRQPPKPSRATKSHHRADRRERNVLSPHEAHSVGCALLDMGHTLCNLASKLQPLSGWDPISLSCLGDPLETRPANQVHGATQKTTRQKCISCPKWWELRLLVIPLVPTSQQYSISLRCPSP